MPNNILYSSDFNDPSWTQDNLASVVDNGLNSLGLREHTINIGADYGIHRLYATNVSAQTAYAIAKLGTGRYLIVRHGGAATTDYSVFDLQDKVVTENGSTSVGTITVRADGSCKCEITTSLQTSFTAVGFSNTGTPNTSQPSYNGAGETYVLSHVQAEETPFSTPPEVTPNVPPTWAELPTFEMRGGLHAFWNIGVATGPEHEPIAHGFEPLSLLNVFADYANNGANQITAPNPNNPWDRTPDYETIVRENIAFWGTVGRTTHDIEFTFEPDAGVAWNDLEARAASGTSDGEEFRYRYYREWASWHALALQWAKEIHPSAEHGTYGRQAFERDYWGFVQKTEDELKAEHAVDRKVWQHVDAEADFYVSSIYVFYDDPSAVFYMAGNVEENYLATRQFGDRPVYAYTWLRFNEGLGGDELPDYMAETMAIVPFFSGAKGIVLWGAEAYTPQPYYVMGHYMESLGRIAQLSDKIGRGQVVIPEPAHILWREKRPLLRYIALDQELLVMAVNPWQRDGDTMTMRFAHEGFEGEVTMAGRRTTLLRVTHAAEVTEI